MEMINMINKRFLLRLFIIVFAINILYFISYSSQAASLTVNSNSLKFDEGKNKTIRVTYVDPGHITDNIPAPSVINEQKSYYESGTNKTHNRRI